MEVIPTGGLIRDRLPEALQEEGFACRTRKAEGRELSGLLHQELLKALQQNQVDPSPENLAEVLDLLEASAQNSGISWQQVKEAQKQLREQQGEYSCLVLEALLPTDAPSLPDRLTPQAEVDMQSDKPEMIEAEE